MSQNDLQAFLKAETDAIAAEYERIQARVREDTGTAGDQGEENWAQLLRQWLPHTYHVVTKGRILSKAGEASPQVDVLVLSPTYPPALLNKKLYLAGGVLAAFECKLSLISGHLEKVFETATALSRIGSIVDSPRNPHEALMPNILYGVLAHSHRLGSTLSRAAENMTQELVRLDQIYVQKPAEMPDFFCVADLGTWYSSRSFFPEYLFRPGERNPPFEAFYEKWQVRTGYLGHVANAAEQTESFTPIGCFLTRLFEVLASRDRSTEPIARHIWSAGAIGHGGTNGNLRCWPSDVLPARLQAGLNQLNYRPDGFGPWRLHY